jgi:hypothetical protein
MKLLTNVAGLVEDAVTRPAPGNAEESVVAGGTSMLWRLLSALGVQRKAPVAPAAPSLSSGRTVSNEVFQDIAASMAAGRVEVKRLTEDERRLLRAVACLVPFHEAKQVIESALTRATDAEGIYADAINAMRELVGEVPYLDRSRAIDHLMYEVTMGWGEMTDAVHHREPSAQQVKVLVSQWEAVMTPGVEPLPYFLEHEQRFFQREVDATRFLRDAIAESPVAVLDVLIPMLDSSARIEPENLLACGEQGLVSLRVIIGATTNNWHRYRPLGWRVHWVVESAPRKAEWVWLLESLARLAYWRTRDLYSATEAAVFELRIKARESGRQVAGLERHNMYGVTMH